MSRISRPPIFWHEDTSPAAWLEGSLAAWGENVGSIVPGGFAAYARVLHPAGHGDAPEVTLSRWADIARSNGRVAHPGMQFHNIIRPRGSPSASPDHMPAPGALPVHERALLVELLERETTSIAQCWFCLWEGWAAIDDRGVVARVLPTSISAGRTSELTNA